MDATLKKIHPRPNMEPDDEINYIKPNARTSYCYVRLATLTMRRTKSPAEISIKGGCMTIGGLACRRPRPRHHVSYVHLIRTKTGCEVAPTCNLQVGASICDAIENTCGGAKLPLAPLPPAQATVEVQLWPSGCIGALRIGRGLAQVSQLLEPRCL